MDNQNPKSRVLTRVQYNSSEGNDGTVFLGVVSDVEADEDVVGVVVADNDTD